MAEKNEQASHVAALKSRLDAYRTNADARLQQLTLTVRAARSEMEKQLALASRILQLAERCRQFEGEGEKIIPVPVPDITVGEDAGGAAGGAGVATGVGGSLMATRGAPTAATATATLTAGDLVPLEMTAARHGFVPKVDGVRAPSAVARPSLSATAAARGAMAPDAAMGGDEEGAAVTEEGGTAGTAGSVSPTNADLEAAASLESQLMRETIESGELDALDLFWRRYNRTLLEKLVMERRREALAAENAQLQAVLSQYLQGLSLSDDALAAPEGNPLLVVNGRTGIVPGRAFGGRATAPRTPHPVGAAGHGPGAAVTHVAPPLVVEAAAVARNYTRAGAGW